MVELLQIIFESGVHGRLADDAQRARADMRADGAADLADDDVTAVISLYKLLLDLLGRVCAVGMDDGDDLAFKMAADLAGALDYPLDRRLAPPDLLDGRQDAVTIDGDYRLDAEVAAVLLMRPPLSR